jgi:hypothetical protein
VNGKGGDADLSWPVVVVCRVLPIALLVIGIVVPAAFWSRLPPHSLRHFMIAAVGAVIGVGVLIPQAWRPHAALPEPFEPGDHDVNIYGSSWPAWWLRSQFGPVGSGLFFLSAGSATSVTLTVGNLDARKWGRLPLLVILGVAAGAFLVALLGGLVMRRYGGLAEG